MDVGPRCDKTAHPGGRQRIGRSQLRSTASRKFAGANVFILFDTSNYMYRGFVFAQDAIADFVRSLEGVSKVALYSYSRDLSRVDHPYARPLPGSARRAQHSRRRRRRAL